LQALLSLRRMRLSLISARCRVFFSPNVPPSTRLGVSRSGNRLVRICERSRSVLKIFTRNGHDWTDRLPKLADALAHLPVDNAWIDGEAVALDASGKPDFNALQNAFDRRSTGRLVPEAVQPGNRPSVAIPRTY
jgi:hypothetical protein